MPPSYDPELNLVLAGTSVTAPAPKFMLDGVDKDYLYHNSTLALDGDTGEIRWYYQHLRDHWDLDHPFERLLVDTVVAPDPDTVRWLNPSLVPGEERKVVTGIPGKTGVVYTLDRATGEFLWVHEQRASTTSLAATGGGLLFGGDLNGRFKAFDQGTGEVLWEINLGSPVTEFPISFAVDGRQYIAVSTGHSGISSMLLRLTRELRPSAGNNLFVFALPE